MSKYTTEVRFICEHESGLEESKGANNVDTILNNSWDKIFTTTCEFFDSEYKPILCKKILKHYYTREIGAETVGLWKLWVNRKLEEVMPYYNQLYSSALLEFNPLHDLDINTSHTKTNNGTVSGSRTGSGTNANTGSSHSLELYSDTPQGGVTNLQSQAYLTNATDVNRTDGQNGTYSDTETTSGTNADTENYIERVYGKQGSGSYSKLLSEFRETFLNIDMLVVDEFADCFLNLW